MSKINQINDGELHSIEDSSAIKSSSLVSTISSQSTYSQIPSAKLVYDKLSLLASALSELFKVAVHYDPVQGFILDDGTLLPLEDIIDLDAYIEEGILEFKQNLTVTDGYIILSGGN